MPRQLIYTSAPRGLTPGQSGYCTVARSRDLREALIPRIEKLSYYQTEPNHNPVICAHRILDLRGTKFHVLTRIVDAGLDFTRRRSFLAHHVIFEPNELLDTAAPAEIFLRWKGWIDQWQGDPLWLEDNRPFPAPANRETTIAKSDVWVSGDETDRQIFLPTLAERADWNITFTNCFQPGDHGDDFDIKAAWPGTPGYDTAKQFDAVFTSLQDLPRHASPATAPLPKPQPQLVESIPPVLARRRPAASLSRDWPYLAAVLIVIAVALALLLRPNQTSRNLLEPPPAPALPRDEIAGELDVLFPDRPTWIIVPQFPAVIPPLAELMRKLRANEIFTKDISATLQANLLKPPEAAALFADPEQNLLRFTAGDSPPVEVVTAPLTFKTSRKNSFAAEVPGRFRIIGIQAPVHLPLYFLTLATNVELHPNFAERIHQAEPPPGAQFALRPLVQTKGSWVDPLAEAARDFGIVPSTILDLSAVHNRAAQVIAGKESQLRAYEEEHTQLVEEQRKLGAQAVTPEQSKAKSRLKSLERDIPKARAELELLRARAAAIPKDPAHIDRFALFLCLSNVNTEVFRFSDKP